MDELITVLSTQMGPQEEDVLPIKLLTFGVGDGAEDEGESDEE